MNLFKIVLYANTRIVIFNYRNIIYIKEEEIRIDNLLISGSNLKISLMDDYIIEIIGTINKVNYV